MRMIFFSLYESYGLPHPVSFSIWLFFGLPHAVLCFGLTLAWLQLFFLGWRQALRNFWSATLCTLCTF